MKSKNVLPAFVLILIILTLISGKIIALCLNITTIEKSHLTYDMLTEEEKTQFRQIRSQYSEADVQKIYKRFQQDPKREGAFDRAIRNSLSDKLSRETAEIVRAFRNPQRILDAMHQFFASRTGDKGEVSALDLGVGIFDFSVDMIIAPGRILGQWVGGEESETPIQDVVQFLLLPILLTIAAWRTKRIHGSIVGWVERSQEK